MVELAIELKSDTGKCMYQQIYEYIRNEIRTGKLPQDEKLPSTRSLAEYLGISRSTVDTAYQQLLEEGYLRARPCRGYFVSRIENLLDMSAEAVPGTGGEAPVLEEEKPVFAYDFSPHAIDMSHFPYSTWKKITREILVDANQNLFSLGMAQGDERLRVTISRYLHSARGVDCLPEQIVIGAGSDYLLILLDKILGSYLKVAMENPTYQRAYRIFKACAGKIYPIPMDKSGICVKQLKKTDAEIVYVMPSHQYPTGTVMPIGRRLELLQWAKERENRYIIEDDYDSEFRYKGRPIPALAMTDKNDKVIYIGTFSKSIAPAIRVGYMVLPLRLLQAYRRNCSFFASTVSRIDQSILNEFIQNGYFERYLNKMRKLYREKHDFLLDAAEVLKEAFTISGENAGLHILLTSKKGLSEKEILTRAGEKGIRLYGFTEALIETSKEEKKQREERPGGTVLLGYGALTLREIKEGIYLLAKGL